MPARSIIWLDPILFRSHWKKNWEDHKLYLICSDNITGSFLEFWEFTCIWSSWLHLMMRFWPKTGQLRTRNKIIVPEVGLYQTKPVQISSLLESISMAGNKRLIFNENNSGIERLSFVNSRWELQVGSILKDSHHFP